MAAVLSFFVPGLGHIYKGRVLTGLFLLVITLMGYAMLIVPGVMMHIICILLVAGPQKKCVA